MKLYEETIVIDGSLDNEQINEQVKTVEDVIQAHGGKISEVNRWGRRKLAYPIRKQTQGYYVVIRYEAEGTAITPIEHEFELNEAILRYLTITAEKESSREEGK